MNFFKDSTSVAPELDYFLSTLSDEDRQLVWDWSESVFERTEQSSGKLDRLFARIPSLTRPLTVYRGLNVDDITQVVFDLEHFTATAINAAATKRFAGADCCFMEIRIPPGAKVLPVSFSHGLTRYPKDVEVLLPRNGIFKVAGSKKIDLAEEDMNMYGPEIAAMIRQAMQKSVRRYRDEKTFVIVDYIPNGRMTRALATHNIEMLERIYGIPYEGNSDDV